MAVVLDWIYFEEVVEEEGGTEIGWGEDYAIIPGTDRAFWVIPATTTLVNARYRGIRESEKNNQVMLDVSYDLATLFYQFSQLEGRFAMVKSPRDTDRYLLPTENQLTIHLEGEDDTNYTMWWGQDENIRILTMLDQDSEDNR